MQLVDNLCWLCQQPLAIPQHYICSICLGLLPKLPVCCRRCGLPLENNEPTCRECEKSPSEWHHLIMVSDYCSPIKDFIMRLKFHGEDKYAPLLSRLFLLTWLHARRTRSLPRPDLLITVPLHHRRHWRRGFNQTDPLAKNLSYWVNCRYSSNIILRHRATAAQQSLSAKQRSYNLLNAFSCHGDIRELHIALLDDIVTTGSTVAEISRLLLSHGAASVQVWCLCRTLKNDLK